jgi:hypothetical protein
MEPITEDDCGMYDGEPCEGPVKNRMNKGDGKWITMLIYCDAHWAKHPDNPEAVFENDYELRRKAKDIAIRAGCCTGDTGHTEADHNDDLADAIEAALRERDYQWWAKLCMVDNVPPEPDAVHRFVLLMQEEAVAEELEAQTTILKEHLLVARCNYPGCYRDSMEGSKRCSSHFAMRALEGCMASVDGLHRYRDTGGRCHHCGQEVVA